MNFKTQMVCFVFAFVMSIAAAAPSFAAEDDKDIIPVGELAVGFSENALQPSNDLVGKSFTLYIEDGPAVKHVIKDKEVLSWEIVSGEHKGDKGHCEYLATNPRKGIYFLDFVDFDGTSKSISVVLDFNKKIATGIFGWLPTKEAAAIPIWTRAQKKMRLTPIDIAIWHASIDKPFTKSTKRHPKTEELIGKRIQYNYSARDAYEHVYLNDHLYTWHCIAGNEKGQADTEMCNYYKIDDNLYLFTWQEKIVPTLGVVMVNLDPAKMKTTGKIYGYEGVDFGRVINFPVGAYAKILSNTQFDFSKLKK